MLKKFLFTFLVAGILFFSSSTALSESSGELTLVGQSPWVTNDEIVFDLRVSGFDDNGFFKITAHEAIDRSNLIALKAGDLPPSIGTAITIPLTEKLNSTWQEISTKLYQETETQETENPTNTDATDVEFEEVK